MLELQEVLGEVHFGSQLFSCPAFVLRYLSGLPVPDLLDQVCCSGLIVVHELVPSIAKLLKLCLLGLLSLQNFALVQNFEVFVPALQLARSDLFDLVFAILSLFVVAILLRFLTVLVQEPIQTNANFKNSINRSSTRLQRAYFSSIRSEVTSDKQKMNRNSSKEAMFSQTGKLISWYSLTCQNIIYHSQC